MNLIKGFFSEGQNEGSMSRLLAFVCAMMAALTTIAGLMSEGGKVDGALVAQWMGWSIAFKHGGRALEDRKGGA